MNRLTLMSALVLTIGGCANGALTTNSVNTIDDVVAIGCPVLTAVKTSGLALTSNQKAAIKTLSLACPPNPPPTSDIVALADLIQAYTILKPLVK